MGRPHQFVQLDAIERDFLTGLVRKGECKAIELNRARMLLWSAEAVKAEEIAVRLGMSYGTVTQTLKQYRDAGLERALYDAHRSGAPRKITPELEAHITAISCSDSPEGKAKWTVEMLKDEVIRLKVVETISKTSVHTVLKKANSSLVRKRCGASAK